VRLESFMTAARMPSEASADRLRGDIDAGRTGEKVSWPDPSAAPLGTDDEAAGTSSPRQAIDAARTYKNSSPHGGPDTPRSGAGLVWWVGIFGLIVGSLVAWAVLAS
jgi:hypothetical protein